MPVRVVRELARVVPVPVRVVRELAQVVPVPVQVALVLALVAVPAVAMAVPDPAAVRVRAQVADQVPVARDAQVNQVVHLVSPEVASAVVPAVLVARAESRRRQSAKSSTIWRHPPSVAPRSPWEMAGLSDFPVVPHSRIWQNVSTSIRQRWWRHSSHSARW